MPFRLRLTHVRASAAILLLASSLGAGPASAQLHADHLECWRGHDNVRLRGVVEIDNAQFGLPKDCRIKPAQFFCAPAAKSVVEVNVGPLLPVSGGRVPGDFVCYRVRCPKTDIADQTVTDQFGTRVFKLNRSNRRLKRGSFLLCAPAVTGTEFCGDGVTNGSETCDGNDAAACPGACQVDCTCPAATPVPCTTATPIPTATPGPRFVDNGDGTVTDNETGLQWEKKVGNTCDAGANAGASCTVASECPGGACSCPGPHCVDNSYTWTATPGGTAPDGTAFTSFLAMLNGGVTGVGNCVSTNGATQTGGFAGHCDWRLPTIAELSTILAPCGMGPCIDSAFGPTAAAFYWSSTSHPAALTNAWDLSFSNGAFFVDPKTFVVVRVRAVRGGS